MSTLKEARLVCVSSKNNNKFYHMKENGNGTFTAKWGRIEGDIDWDNIQRSSFQQKDYPMKDWDKAYKKRTQKPVGQKSYTDVTHLFEEAKVSGGTKQIIRTLNTKIENIVNMLQNYANVSLQNNYTISSHNVTQRQVDAAQTIIDDVVALLNGKPRGIDVQLVDDKLLDLYQVIPRKMKKVQEHLVQSISIQDDVDRAQKLLAEEQQNLDVMANQVRLNAQEEDEPKEAQVDLMASLGLMMEPVTNDEKQMILQLMGHNSNQYKRAYKVINKTTQKRFDNWLEMVANRDTELFWHGSRNENWWSIINTGLVLRPANAVITGKMFGYGLYFADKCQKSVGYSSLRGSYWTGGSDNRGFLALFDVHTGRQLKIQRHQYWCYDLTEKKLKERGSYDSLFALGGADLRNNEYIVYNQAQTTIKYIVEIG